MNYSPDGLWLAVGGSDGSVTVWDPHSGSKIWDAGRHQHYVYTANFGRDDRTLLSGGRDGVCYLWDLKRGDQAAKELPRIWDELGDDDSAIAFQAMLALAETPDKTIPWIHEKLRPVTKLIDLNQKLEGRSDEETLRTRRLQRVLIKKDPQFESLSTVKREISVLAQIGTPEAIAVLEELTAKNPDGEVASLARTTLERLLPDRH